MEISVSPVFVKFLDKIVEDIEISLIVSWRIPKWVVFTKEIRFKFSF